MCCKKKMGRPTDNPKTKKMSVRLDQKCQDILERYVQQENITPVEAIRRGIMMLEKEIGR